MIIILITQDEYEKGGRKSAHESVTLSQRKGQSTQICKDKNTCVFKINKVIFLLQGVVLESERVKDDSLKRSFLNSL